MDSMKTIYLVRHCKAAGQGSDAPLTIEGEQQALEIDHFFSGREIDYMVSSPFVRAVDTVKHLRQSKNLQVHRDERLKERILSKMNLMDWMTCLEMTYSDLDLKYEGGESGNEAMSRGIAVIQELLVKAESNFLIVTHGALLSLIIKYYHQDFGFLDWKRLTNPDVYQLEIRNNTDHALKRIWKE